MFRHYFKIGIKSLLRYKTHSAINIFGLSVGIAASLLILLLVHHELQYDLFHEHADRIYRVTSLIESPEESRRLAITSPPIGPMLLNDFPEIENYVRIKRPFEPLAVVRYGENIFHEDKFYFADQSLFDVFSFSLQRGNRDSALRDPHTVVISEETSIKYFGTKDPLYETLEINGKEYLVTGILEQIPRHSHLQFDILASTETLGFHPDDWMSFQLYTYVLVSQSQAVENIAQKIPSFIDAYFGPRQSDFMKVTELYFQKLSNIYLHSHYSLDLDTLSNIRNIYFYSAIAFVLILIACMNYMNLSTAKYTTRTREIGLRKVLGADRKQLVQQFLGETFIVTFISVVFALIIIELLLPTFNSLTDRTIVLYDALTPTAILSGAIIILLVTSLAGSYPALFLSGLSPVTILKNKLEIGRSDKLQLKIRTVFVVCQFILAIIFITGSLVIYKQLVYIQNKELGFDKEHIVVIPLRDRETRRSIDVLKNEFRQHPGITDISVSSEVPGFIEQGRAVLPEGFEDEMSKRILSVDHNFLSMYNIEVIAGRNFDRSRPADAETGFMLNMAAISYFGWGIPEEAIGKRIRVSGMAGVTKTGYVQGVVQDFHFASLHKPIEPLVIFIHPPLHNRLSVKIQGAQTKEVLSFLHSIWSELIPHIPFDYSFLDVDIGRLYHAEIKTGKIVRLFTILIISIAGLGLFGLASFTTERRVKEIGIRKALGATVTSIIVLLTGDFIKLLVISFILATPISLYGINIWLENFAYKIDITWWLFVIVAVLAAIVTLVAVNFHAIRAAITNPVESLRYE